MIADAVVIGAGPNGLVAANVLADAGWSVVVLEANAEPGGAVRTAEVTAPGVRNDLFSAFYPLTAVSPVIADLELHRWGLRWVHAPAVLAHPRHDGPTAMLHRDRGDTAAGLDRDHQGDGTAFLRQMDEWDDIGESLIGALLHPFPPIRDGLRFVHAAGPARLRELVRRAIVPLRRFVDEEYGGQNAALLHAGTALHADLSPESAGSALFGWLLVCLGQQAGFPVPLGGADRITSALVDRLADRGGQVVCDARVTRVVVRGGRAVGVIAGDLGEVTARRAVVADCDATKLFVDMVGEEHLPAEVRRGIRRIERSASTFKIDWAIDGEVPWSDTDVSTAGTVHLADDLAELSATATQIATGWVPSKPFVLLGQMTVADATRSPAGTSSVWAYTHVPQQVRGDAAHTGEQVTGAWSGSDVERFAARVEARVEAHAPGFTSRIIARHVASPHDLEAADANLVGGDISGGTAQLHQQLVFRPMSGWARAETPVPGLYLGSASAHPGGAVHGACGANAARAAIAHHRGRRVLHPFATARRNGPPPPA